MAEKELVERAARSFVDHMLQSMGLSPGEAVLQKFSCLMKMLYLSAKFCPYATSVLFNRIYYFSVLFQKYNTLVYQIAEQSMAQFSQNIGRDMSFYVKDILFWICLVWPEFYNHMFSKTALIISDFGRQHGNFLAKLLSDLLNKEGSMVLNPTVASYPEVLSHSAYEGYDLIITTIPRLPIPHQDVILISDYPSYDNLCEIYRALHK